MASDIFLFIDGIPGESTDEQYGDHIEVLSYNDGANMPTTPASTGGYDISGRCDIDPFIVSKAFDASSPLIRRALCLGTKIPKVELLLRRMVEEKSTLYMKYTLKNAKIVNVNASGMGTGGIPTESLTFVFEEIWYEYTKTGASGNVVHKWSPKKNAVVK